VSATVSTTTSTTAGEKLWGVGQIRGGGAVLPYPVTAAELARDSVWAGRQLVRHGIAPGKFVLLVSMSNEGVQVHPFDSAAASAGLPLCQVDAVLFEAPRVISAMKNLPVGLVLGMTGGILTAITEAGRSLADTFGDIPVLLRPDAADIWRQHTGRPALSWYPLGPAVAFECPAASGAHVNGTEWAVRADESGLLVTGLAGGRRRFADVRTGRAGRLLTARCECGSEDPRIVLTGADMGVNDNNGR
jgi:hypothetical protein